MTYFFLLAALLTAILLGIIVIPNILLISYKKRLFDVPDERKVHSAPVPRLGGLSFFPVILITCCLIMGICYYADLPIRNLPAGHSVYPFLFFSVGFILLYLIGVTDDLIGVSYRYKFLVQILAALLLVLSGNWINSLGGLLGIYEIPAWVGMPLTMLIVVYITNAINLIDGIDGLASGLSCIALVSLGIMNVLVEQYVYALLAFATLGVLIPFWFYNVFGNASRGHKLFMGDAGSLTLGYILSFLVIHLSMSHLGLAEHGCFNMIVAFSTLLVPMLDVVRVVLHRVRTGKNPFLPDKNHFHHKLLRTGMRVRMVMVVILFISLFFIGLNILLTFYLSVSLLLVVNLVLWTLLHLFINRCIRGYEENNKKVR